jgi:hypothetical protein
MHVEDGRVLEVRLDDSSNARLTVQLRGGRIIEDVMLLGQSQGLESGAHDFAPKVGSFGLIAFARKNFAQNRPYWLGTLPNQSQPGLHRESLSDYVWLDASRAGGARDSEGNITTWNDNGDYVYEGDGDAYRPKLKQNDGTVIVAPARRRAIKRVFEWAKTYLVRWRVGRDVVALFDAKARRIVHSVGSTAVIIEDGRIELRADVVKLGTKPELGRPSAVAEPTRDTLTALSKEVERLKLALNDLGQKYNALKSSTETALQTHVHPGLGSVAVPPPILGGANATNVASPYGNDAVPVPEIEGLSDV